MSSDHLEEPDEPAGPKQEPTAHRRRPPDGWHWKLIFAMILGAILVLLALIVLGLYGADQNDKATASEQTLGDLASQVQAACVANPADARKVFGDVCGKAKEIDARPVGEKGDPGAKGDPGSPGSPGAQGIPGPPPTAAQVAAAVSSYCSNGRCTGKGPTASQVAIAVSAYCNSKGQCQGPTGSPGSVGSPGSQGSPGATGEQGIQGIQGEQGPGPTAAQIEAAVTAYCSQDIKPCMGTPGADGKDGAAGRGIADTDCQEDGSWLITYTDGTTDTARGPCRAVVLPTSASR